MKKHAYFIGIDNGGSAIKAAVFDENGRELSVSQITNSHGPSKSRLDRTGSSFCLERQLPGHT